jgi:bifunctional DNA-binding transcriptional regulator/antitoxin component of YhaV-PrlF toxin-antitoxin module
MTDTILQRAHSKYPSLRSTVPVTVTRQFGLDQGDVLHWEIRAIGVNKFEVVVTPRRGDRERVRARSSRKQAESSGESESKRQKREKPRQKPGSVRVVL